MGPDGHTASLLPGDKLLDERKRWVGAVAHGRPEVRIDTVFGTWDGLRSSLHDDTPGDALRVRRKASTKRRPAN